MLCLFLFIMLIGNYPVFPTCICCKSSSSSPFGLSLQSGIATAYYLSPNHPFFNVHLHCTNLPPYPPSSHPKIFSLVSLCSSFTATPFYISFLLTYSWSLFMTCPYHLSLPSLIFIPIRSILTVPPMYSFLFLSFLVTPIANLNHFHLCDFYIFHLFLCDRHRLRFIHHCWSHH